MFNIKFCPVNLLFMIFMNIPFSAITLQHQSAYPDIVVDLALSSDETIALEGFKTIDSKNQTVWETLGVPRLLKMGIKTGIFSSTSEHVSALIGTLDSNITDTLINASFLTNPI